jgi:FkbM family methyltransferase
MNRSDFENACRASAKHSYMGQETMLLTPLGAVRGGGLRMVADSGDRGIVPHLMLDGFWESWVSVWLLNELQRRGPGVKLLNVGANCGYYSMLAAATGASVIAVEPHGVHCKNLRSSALLSGLHERLKVVHGVCSDEAGEAQVSFVRGHSMDTFVDRSPATAAMMDSAPTSPATLNEPRATVTVPQLTADAIMPDADILLMDAEGHEPFVWSGAAVLRSNPAFCAAIEWSPLRYDDPSAFYSSITGEGFVFATIDSEGREMAVSREAMMAKETMVTIRRSAPRR